MYGAIGSCGVGCVRPVVKAGRTASFRNATTVGGEKESNMFDFKMFDSEHRAWLSEREAQPARALGEHLGRLPPAPQ